MAKPIMATDTAEEIVIDWVPVVREYVRVGHPDVADMLDPMLG